MHANKLYRVIRNCTLVLQKLPKSEKLIILKKKFIFQQSIICMYRIFSEDATVYIHFARLDSVAFFFWAVFIQLSAAFFQCHFHV